MSDRYDEAIRCIDAANAEDPRTELADGRQLPRELLFGQRTYAWIPRLIDGPSEALLLAARAHTLRRWMIPRDRYPQTNLGYHEWRDALAAFHAEEAAAVLGEVSYDEPTIHRVRALIVKQHWPGDPEARALEDADCLVFLEAKLAGYVAEWGEEKTLTILRGTWSKMTPAARAYAYRLPLGETAGRLWRSAAGDAPT